MPSAEASPVIMKTKMKKINNCIYMVTSLRYFPFHFPGFRLFVIKITEFSHLPMSATTRPEVRHKPAVSHHGLRNDCDFHAVVRQYRCLLGCEANFQFS